MRSLSYNTVDTSRIMRACEAEILVWQDTAVDLKHSRGNVSQSGYVGSSKGLAGPVSCVVWKITYRQHACLNDMQELLGCWRSFRSAGCQKAWGCITASSLHRWLQDLYVMLCVMAILHLPFGLKSDATSRKKIHGAWWIDDDRVRSIAFARQQFNWTTLRLSPGYEAIGLKYALVWKRS